MSLFNVASQTVLECNSVRVMLLVHLGRPPVRFQVFEAVSVSVRCTRDCGVEFTFARRHLSGKLFDIDARGAQHLPRTRALSNVVCARPGQLFASSKELVLVLVRKGPKKGCPKIFPWSKHYADRANEHRSFTTFTTCSFDSRRLG